MSQNNYVIYKFTSPSGKSYIGQTKNLIERIRQHQKTKRCRAFSSAIQKYGFENFTQEILKENLTIDEANQWEEFYIREHNTLFPNGYNLVTGGLNKIASEESKKRMSKAQAGNKNNIGRRLSEETKRKIGIAHKGRVIPEETKRKMSESRTKERLSPETRVKMSQSAKNRTQESRFDLAGFMKGKIISEETRRKISEAGKGRVPPNKGKKLSKESIEKRTATRARKREEKLAQQQISIF